MLQFCNKYVILITMKTNTSQISMRIKERRMALGLSVDDLAKKINKNRATIYRYENGDIENMPMNILEPLAKALQTTPSFLLGWEDKKDTATDNTIRLVARGGATKEFKVSDEQRKAIETLLGNDYIDPDVNI